MCIGFLYKVNETRQNGVSKLFSRTELRCLRYLLASKTVSYSLQDGDFCANPAKMFTFTNNIVALGARFILQ